MNWPASIATLVLTVCLAAPTAPALEIEPNEPTPRVMPPEPNSGPASYHDAVTPDDLDHSDGCEGDHPTPNENYQPRFGLDLQAQVCTFSTLGLRRNGESHAAIRRGRTPPWRLRAELRWNLPKYSNDPPQTEEAAEERYRRPMLAHWERYFLYAVFDWYHVENHRSAARRSDFDWRCITLGAGEGIFHHEDVCLLWAGELTADELFWHTSAGSQTDRGLRLGVRPLRLEILGHVVGGGFTVQAGIGVLDNGRLYSVIDASLRLDFALTGLSTQHFIPRLSLDFAFRDLQSYGARATLVRQAGALQPTATLSVYF